MNHSDKLLEVFDDVAKFDASDYSVFTLMLIISTLIGIYFGCFGTKQNTTEEYLLGGKQLSPIPVGISMVASAISGITLIGVPAEIYTEGPTYCLLIPALIFVCFFAHKFYLPIFIELNLTTVYEYIELRFDKSLRSITSLLYCLSCVLYLPAVIYVPSLSLSQVTGINMHIISVGVTLICVFYTMLGGLKAVVWTDFVQTVITLAACFAILIIGTVNIGGLHHVLATGYNDGKMNIFVMDPLQSNSSWNMFFGSMVTWTCLLCTYQSSIQRIMSLPSAKDVTIVLFIYWAGVSLLTLTSAYGGLLIYATYYGCDPIKEKIISKPDQIFPYYVLDKIGYIPALPGLFVAGVFSAALSSLSTGLNTVAGTIYQDCINKNNKEDKNGHIIIKCLVVLIGLFSIGMVFVVEKMGKALSISYILTSVAITPVGTLFVLGMMIPISNTKGAIAATLSSLALLLWICIGSAITEINNGIPKVYPDEVYNCPMINSTMHTIPDNSAETAEENDIFPLYKLSYMLYVPFGIIVGVFFGVIVSYITGPTDPANLDPRLICPPLRRYLPIKPKINHNREEKVMLEDS